MTRKEQLIAQLTAESKTSWKFIAAFPMDQAQYKPHEKNMPMLNLAMHLAELPLWAEMTIHTDELDFEANPYEQAKIDSKEDFLTYFETCVERGIKGLESASESDLDKMWTLRSGATIYSTTSKADVIRMAHNQTVHHRAQLGVYYRLLGIPVPQSYGPTADFPNFE